MKDDKILNIGNNSIVLAFGSFTVYYLCRTKNPACRLIRLLQTNSVSYWKPLVKPLK